MTEMDPCPELSVLSSFLDDELTDDEKKRLKFHLQGCPACAGRLRSMEEGEQLLVRNLGRSMTLSEYSRKEGCISAETMASYLHGLLSSEEKRRVEGHLDLCDACLSEFTSLAKTEVQLGQSKAEPLPVALRERVEALWKKKEREKEQILRLAVRLAREGIEIVRDSLFPQAVSFQEVFATAGAYRDTLPKSSLPSGILVKRKLPGMQLSLLVQREQEDRTGLKIKIEDEKFNPLGGQRVLLRREGVLLYSERTGSDGRVVITSLEPGAYQLGINISGKEHDVDLEITRA